MITHLQGDCREILPTIPDKTFHAICTSPPYWGLRAYGVGHDNGEIGSEPRPDCLGWATGHPCGECHICVMVQVFRECRRVLRDDGTMYVNYGDVFAASRSYQVPDSKHKACDEHHKGAHGVPAGLKQGDLIGLPWRLALALQADGWTLRQDNIWAKPAPMPESINGWRWERCRVNVDRAAREHKGHERLQGARAENGKDFDSAAEWQDCPGCPKCSATGGYILRKGSWRTTRAHEYVFMFTKGMQYFADAEAGKEAGTGWHGSNFDTGKTADHQQQRMQRRSGNKERKRGVDIDPSQTDTRGHGFPWEGNTRNPRSVWTIGPDPLSAAHFAAFPRELVRRCLISSTSAKGCCPECGTPWARVVSREKTFQSGSGKAGNLPTGKQDLKHAETNSTPDIRMGPCVESTTLGWRPACGCSAGLKADDYEIVASPTGSRKAPDPSKAVGRAGYARPRGDNEGTDGMTRYEQRQYAEQIKQSAHRAEMEADIGSKTTFAHYIRTDRAGQRPVPRDVLMRWIDNGWLKPVAVPDAKPADPVPCRVLDPFGGSGRTAEVAQGMGMDVTLIEINPEYIDMQREQSGLFGIPENP